MWIGVCQTHGENSRSLHYCMKNFEKGFLWLGGRLKSPSTTRPDNLRVQHVKSRSQKKQQWSIEKPKLDNARKLRGFYFIDPDVGEFKDTTENARKKLETRMEAAMLCKLRTKKRSSKSRETDDETKRFQQNS